VSIRIESIKKRLAKIRKPDFFATAAT